MQRGNSRGKPSRIPSGATRCSSERRRREWGLSWPTSNGIIDVMETTMNECLPENTYVYRTEDGTTYLYDPTKIFSERLYVECEGRQVFAKLPDDNISAMVDHGNEIYFFSKAEKIYKVEFSFSDGFKVTHLRDKAEGEVFHRGVLGSRMINGKKWFYRLWVDPNINGIEVGTTDEDLKYLEF
ncbi:hypothetical protein PMAYCL1PPCAC_08910, partial [Pristionchus mayeri]